MKKVNFNEKLSCKLGKFINTTKVNITDEIMMDVNSNGTGKLVLIRYLSFNFNVK